MLPTFLGIGSMRCGTTWLYNALRKHPQITMSEPKELKYFDKRILRKSWKWYEDRFNPDTGMKKGYFCGEISTGYCKLDRNSVDMIKSLLPDARIVYMIRNPIERSWSQALYELGMMKGREFESISVGSLIRYLEQKRIQLYNDYERTIDIWTNVFGEEAFYLGLYDRLCVDPTGHLQAVLEHIGADIDKIPSEMVLQKRVLSTPTIEIPNEINHYLSSRYLAPMEKLNIRLGGKIDHWIESMDRVEEPVINPGSYNMINRSIMTIFENQAYDIYEKIRQHLRRYHMKQILNDRRKKS